MGTVEASPDDVPNDAEIDDMSDAALESLAREVLGPEYVGSRRRTRQNLRKFRDGGIPMKHTSKHSTEGCDYAWVWQGTGDRKYVKCPRCTSSLSVRANRQDR